MSRQFFFLNDTATARLGGCLLVFLLACQPEQGQLTEGQQAARRRARVLRLPFAQGLNRAHTLLQRLMNTVPKTP